MLHEAAYWDNLAKRVLDGYQLTMDEGLRMLQAGAEELLPIMQGAYRIRSTYYGRKVKLNMIINAKSGLCPEDCGYCSQSRISKAPITTYPMLDKETILAGAREAMARKAGTYCIVASGRGPSERDLQQVIEAVKEIRETMPLKLCACLGLLSEAQSSRLADAGVHRYNHNLNTSPEHYSAITSTHSYEQRVETVERAKSSGMSPCSGAIIGMGESMEDVYRMALTLRELDADSIPINFLNAIPGTPLESMPPIAPSYGLKVLALFRYMCPTKEIRAAGGREVRLKSLQPLALYAANSIFVGDYLTTEGQDVTLDHQMIEDLGFEIETCAL